MSVIEAARAAELLSSLGDPTRLAVLATLDRGPLDLTELATAVGRPVRQVGDAVARLVGYGAVKRVDGRYVAVLETFRDAANALDATNPIAPLLTAFPRLQGVFSHGRLVALPDLSLHGHDLAVLLGRLVALDGEVDEAEINRRLAVVSADVAVLRRLMVDEGILVRDAAGRAYRAG